jgi:hypothetical protein
MKSLQFTLASVLSQLKLKLEPVTEPTARLLGTHRIVGRDDPQANHGLGLMGKQLENRQDAVVHLIASRLGLAEPDFDTEGDYHGDGIRVGSFCDSVYVTLGPSTYARKTVADQLGVKFNKCSEEEWATVVELAAEL